MKKHCRNLGRKQKERQSSFHQPAYFPYTCQNEWKF